VPYSISAPSSSTPQCAKGDFAALHGGRQRRRSAETKVSAIPEVGFGDPPPANRPAVWVYEIKLDGFGLAARIDNGRAQLLTRTALDSTGPTDIPARSRRSPM
jgi:hypothetical protein